MQRSVDELTKISKALKHPFSWSILKVMQQYEESTPQAHILRAFEAEVCAICESQIRKMEAAGLICAQRRNCKYIVLTETGRFFASLVK